MERGSKVLVVLVSVCFFILGFSQWALMVQMEKVSREVEQVIGASPSPQILATATPEFSPAPTPEVEEATESAEEMFEGNVIPTPTPKVKVVKPSPDVLE